MSLKPNQIKHRADQCVDALRRIVGTADEDDTRTILNASMVAIVPDFLPAPVAQSVEDMSLDILRAIKEGLARNNPQMVRAALDWMDGRAAKEYLKELTVNITPYTIADTSLRNIVLKAGDDVVKEVAAALAERLARGRVTTVEEEE